jgi:hypothetical protein
MKSGLITTAGFRFDIPKHILKVKYRYLTLLHAQFCAVNGLKGFKSA